MQPLLATFSLPLAGLLVAGSPSDPPAATGPENLLRALPEHPVAYFGLWDVDGLRARGEKSAWYRFYMDAQVQELVGAVGGLIEKAMAEDPDAPELPFKIMDLCDAVHGSVAGFVDVTVAEEQVVAGLLFDVGSKREGLEEIFDSVLGLCEEELETSGESYGSAELVRMDAPDGDGHIIFIDHASLLGAVISNESESGIEAVHGMLDRYTGKDDGEGLGGSSSLAEARATARGSMDIECMVNLAPMIDAIIAEEQPDEMTMSILQKIGVTGLRWFYFGERIGSGEAFESTVSGYLPPDSYLADVFALIGPAPVDFLKKIPAGSNQVSISRFDVHGLYELVMRAIRDHDEELHAQANGMIQMVGAMNGIDIEKDVLSQFTGDIGSFVVPSTQKAEYMETMMLGVAPGGALLVGLEDPEEFELFVDDMLSNFQLDSMMDVVDFQGTEIRKFDLGGPAAYFTFTDGALLYAGSLEPIQAVLRLSGDDEQPSAYDDAELRKLARPGTLSLSRMDTAGMVAMYLDLFSGISEMMGMYGIDADDNPLTYLPWPDSAIAAKYFDGQILSTMVRSGNTFQIRSWSE